MGHHLRGLRPALLRHSPGVRAQRGQVFVLVAVMLPVMLGMAGLVTDVGYWYVSKRKAQTAADAAALAAAFELPNALNTDAVARNYVNLNVTGSTTTVNTPYAGDANKVEVKVRITRDAFFSRIFGIDQVDITARGVAAKVPGGPNTAIYSHGNHCQNEKLEFNGNGFSIDGAVHTNGKVIVNGQMDEDPDNIDTLTYSTGMGGSCAPEISDDRPNRVTADGPVPARSWPVYINSANYVPSHCSSGFTDVTVDRVYNDSHNGKVICARSYKFDQSNTTASVTVFACRKVEVGGNHFEITPVLDNILFASISNGPTCSGAPNNDLFVINGNNGMLKGFIFNERNLVNYDGNSAAVFEGMIEARWVKVNGNSFTFTGTGPSTSGSSVALLE